MQTFADGSIRIWRSARLVVGGSGGTAGGSSGWELTAGPVAGVRAGEAPVALAVPRLRRVRP